MALRKTLLAAAVLVASCWTAMPASATLYEYRFANLTNPLAELAPWFPPLTDYIGHFAGDDDNGDGIMTRSELDYFFLGPYNPWDIGRLWPPKPFDNSGPSCDPCTGYTHLDQFMWNMNTGEFVAVGGQEEPFYTLVLRTGDYIYDPGGACMMCGPSTYRWTPTSFTAVRVVPEPGSAWLALLGLGMLGAWRARRSA